MNEVAGKIGCIKAIRKFSNGAFTTRQMVTMTDFIFSIMDWKADHTFNVKDTILLINLASHINSGDWILVSSSMVTRDNGVGGRMAVTAHDMEKYW